ncbi:MAG: hypothetical protein IJJ43_06275 [Oscillospiraceae bacterium]|nr:hypothetical protein [Oscillospiraceae bacterium]
MKNKQKKMISGVIAFTLMLCLMIVPALAACGAVSEPNPAQEPAIADRFGLIYQGAFATAGTEMDRSLPFTDDVDNVYLDLDDEYPFISGRMAMDMSVIDDAYVVERIECYNCDRYPLTHNGDKEMKTVNDISDILGEPSATRDDPDGITHRFMWVTDSYSLAVATENDSDEITAYMINAI